MFRWIKRIALVLVALVVLLVAGLYGGSELVIRKSRAVPLEKLTVPGDAASIAEGGRLAKIEGCRHCHGREGQGGILAQDPMLGRIAAPGFADIGARYSNDELARAIRHGVRKDGTTLWIMPSQAHNHIADDDLARIIAWIRTVKPAVADSTAQTSWGPVGRLLVLSGTMPPSAVPGNAAEKARPAEVGRYFTEAVCMGCHAMDKALPAHDGKGMAPALAQVAASYDPAAFATLLKTGKGMTPRDLGLMREVAVESFSSFTDEEIAAIHAYLKGEAAKQAK